MQSADRLKSNVKYTQGNHTLAFNPATYAQIISYLQICLSHDAGVTVDVTSERDVRDESARMCAYVKQLLSVSSDRDVVLEYVRMIRQLLAVHAGTCMAGCQQCGCECPVDCLIGLPTQACYRLADCFLL